MSLALILTGLWGYTCVVAVAAYQVGRRVERARVSLVICPHCGLTYNRNDRDLLCPHKRAAAGPRSC